MRLRQLLLSPDPSTKRLVWVDNAKALLIVLVVIGHFVSLAQPLKIVIYAFHLPAFLFLTGFTLSAGFGKTAFIDFLRKYILPYARLYFFMSAASILLWWAIEVRSLDALQPMAAAAWQAVYGTQSAKDFFVHGNGPLWYLPFLISSFFLLYLVAALPLRFQVIIIVLSYLFTTHYQGPRLPWAIDAAGVGLVFIALGNGVRKALDGPFGNVEVKQWLPLLGLVAMVGLVFVAYLNDGGNINLMSFGKSAFLYLAAACLGTLTVIAACVLLPQTRLANLLSTHSLVIFCIHIYAVKAFQGFIRNLPTLEAQLLVFVCGFLIAIICALVSVVVTPSLDRYVLLRGQTRLRPRSMPDTGSTPAP